MNNTTDTPRTDAEWASTWQTERRLHELCRQLEIELTHSLQNQLQSQSEVERLRSQLKRAVEIAETSCQYLNTGGWNEDEIHSGKDGWVTETEINEVCASLALLKAENQMNNTTDTPSTEESSVVQTDTPRTNKNAFAHYEGFCVSIAFARELERELTEAQAINSKVTKELWMWKHGEMRVERLVKELNATRAALEQMTEDAVRMRNLLE